MSTKTLAILEQLKTLTHLEVAELLTQISETFGVDASPLAKDIQPLQLNKYDVVLEAIPKHKKLAVQKVVWNVSGLDLKRAKALTKSVPTVIKESVSFEVATQVKQQLEAFGATVSLK